MRNRRALACILQHVKFVMKGGRVVKNKLAH